MKKLFLLLLATPFFAATSAPPTYDTYAAIAYSTSRGVTGMGWHQPTQAAAFQLALQTCFAPDCQIAVWAVNGCAALAVGNTFAGPGTAIGVGYNPVVSIAQNSAVNQCFARGQGCRVIASICSNN